MSPEERKLKEERLKNLFKNKVFEIKDYLHRQFMRFYYNGIFVQMQQKNEGDNKKPVKKSKHFSNLIDKFNANNNNNNKPKGILRKGTMVQRSNNNINNEDYLNKLKKTTTILKNNKV